MPRLTSVLTLFYIAMPMPSGIAFADPLVLDCVVDGISVSAPTFGEAHLACDVAETADLRLRSLGMQIEEPVRIELTKELEVAPEACVAFYSTAERKLQVLTVDCLAGQPGRTKAFPSMSADLLFESLITHELVHAYANQSAESLSLPLIAHEYLAYAIQLDALPDTERERLLAKAALEEVVALDAINEATLSLSPLRFAAMSWLHFKQEGGDAALVERVLNGTLRFNSLRE